jgi:hypothetical protein
MVFFFFSEPRLRLRKKFPYVNNLCQSSCDLLGRTRIFCQPPVHPTRRTEIFEDWVDRLLKEATFIAVI